MSANDSSFWQYRVYADIRGGSLGRERQTTVRLSTTAIFSVFAGYFFGSFRHEANVIKSALLYSNTQSVASFSVIPKCMTFNDLECLFRVKFCFRAGLDGFDRTTFERQLREN